MGGELIAVGIGIQFGAQTSPESVSCIRNADKVMYLVADPPASEWLRQLNPTAESLHVFYDPTKERRQSYLEMVDRILSFVRAGSRVCAVSYGHPGVFAFPLHESVRRARAEGFLAKMLPAVSAEDCLVADLGVDPGEVGMQSFEATDFLVFKRRFDVHCALILWQIVVTGDLGYHPQFDYTGVKVLTDYLVDYYGKTHVVVVYEAAQYPFCDPTIQRVPLAMVPTVPLSAISTLYVPPKARAEVDFDMVKRLRIPRHQVEARHGKSTID